MPVLNLLPILYRSPPGSAGNHVVSMINGVGSLNGRFIDTNYETKNVEHYIKYHNQDPTAYQTHIGNLINSGAKAIATHCTMQPIQPVYAVNAYWTKPKLSSVFACRDMLTVKLESILDHVKHDPRLHFVLKAPTRPRKKWLIFMNNLLRYGEGANNQVELPGWNNFCIDNIFTVKFVDDLVNLTKAANLQVNVDLVELSHKKWLERNPPDDFTVRRAVRRLEKFIL